MPVDLVQLRTFVVVAEEQHLTHAAERLHISPSAASAHVRALEERLDTQLFVRTNRSLELTRAGQLLAQKARTLLNEESLFASFARELQGKIEGKLIVGTSSEPGTRIGEMVSTLRAKHPLIHVDLMARASSGTHNGLKSGELDVGILLGRPVDAAFTYYELTTVRYRIAGPVAWRDKILAADWAALASLPWLTPSTSSAHSAMLAQLFVDKGLTLNSAVRFDNIAVGRAALQAGAGMMLLREEHAMQGEQDGYLAISPIAHAETALSVGHQSGRSHDPLIEAFIDAAKSTWPEMKMTRSEPGPRQAAG
jgi:DNA-binding transcriptional LysR family regulator